MKRLLSILFILIISMGRVWGDDAKSLLPRYNYHYTAADSAALRKINERMDSVRRGEKRPTVALVLSGGGAKGFAYIGAMKILQEKNIPIDMVIGCSIGGLMGGLYSMGYDMEELEKTLPYLDWMEIMTDKIPRRILSHQDRTYKDSYNISLPIYKTPGISPSGEKQSGFMKGLPSGLAQGYNAQNLFSALSVGYEYETDFFDMEVPYATVALDLLSNHLKVFHEGNINVAMRSTMSIPGVFAPVKIEDKVLIDGGFMDNFPVSLAKDMGADYIISLYVGSKGKNVPDDIVNVLDVATQYMCTTDMASLEKNTQLVDFFCNPDVYDFGPLSFTDEAIKKLISIGYDAMKAQEGELDSLAIVIGGSRKIIKKKAINLFTTPVKISDVEITGLDAKELEVVEHRVGMKNFRKKLSEPVSKADIDKLISSIVALNTYESVSYIIQGAEEPFRLIIKCVPGPLHQLGVAVRFDTEDVFSVGLHFGLNYHKLTGSKLDFTAKASINPKADLRYSYAFAKFPTINVSASCRYTNTDVFANNLNLLELSYFGAEAKAYLSNARLSMFDFKAGVFNTYYDVRRYQPSVDFVTDFPTQVNRFGPFAELLFNSKDDKYYAHKGLSVDLKYHWNVVTGVNKTNYHALVFNIGGVIPLHKQVALIPNLYNRFLFGNEPIALDRNMLGGSMAGRYFEQQIQFMSINTVIPQDNMLSAGSLSLRYEPVKDVYVSAVGNIARTAHSFDTFFQNSQPFIWGAGIEAAYDSIIGPCVFNVHYNSFDKRVGVYFGVGYEF
ncbi:MAG: patatin-like phospholipase family protein [Bacteroidales bacterium]|nr:patatin-like phospholipase family protein [Bacteroidales bacterium]